MASSSLHDARFSRPLRHGRASSRPSTFFLGDRVLRKKKPRFHLRTDEKDVDARDKPGHDDWVGPTWMPGTSARSKASSPCPGITTGWTIRHHHRQLDTSSSTQERPSRSHVRHGAPARYLRHGREATKLCFAPTSRSSTFLLSNGVVQSA